MSAIVTLFDKRKTYQLGRQLAVPVPAALPSSSEPDELLAHMSRADVNRVYVKLTCGSSASCLALLERDRVTTSVTTTLEFHGTRLYNSLRVKRYARPALVDGVIRFLLREGAHVEVAIDKVAAQGRHADVRLLFIGDCPRFAVLRTNASPITNLHLGGGRGNIEEYRARRNHLDWQAAEAAGRTLARALCTWHLGLDVAFDRHTERPFILEANAFGDLLPQLEYEGRSVYDWEVHAALTRPSV